MPISCRLLLVIPVLALASTLAVGAQSDAPAQPPAQLPAQLPDWAPKPRPNVVEDRFRVEVNLFGASATTQMRVDESPTLPGTEISAEDDLGLEDFELLPQVELTLLPGERHLVRLSAFAMHRSANKLIERQISFDNEDYVIGERVDSLLNLTMFGLTYGYRFVVHRRGGRSAALRVPVVGGAKSPA